MKPHLLARDLVDLGWDSELAQTAEQMLRDLSAGQRELDAIADEMSSSDLGLLQTAASSGLASTVLVVRTGAGRDPE